MTRKFIHCDCDCFFAAIEMRDDPGLRGLPVAVGGAIDRRGVIATCNYEARRYGVRSAMASATARRLCPDLLILPTNMEKYRQVSRQVMALLGEYTDLVEPVSVDEAYLDVTGSTACRGSATLIARQIRRRIREDLGITVSAGIAPNKLLAKIASDWNKPDGQFVVAPAQVADFIARVPVHKLHGVGRVTARRMGEMGIETCRDLQNLSRLALVRAFGGFGDRLYELCRGIDDRPIRTERERKSVSVERTFPEDLATLARCRSMLPDLLEKLRERIRNARDPVKVDKLFVKLKFHDFVSTTVEQSATALDPSIFDTLCETGYQRGNRPVRLLGLGVRIKPGGREGRFQQLTLGLLPGQETSSPPSMPAIREK